MKNEDMRRDFSGREDLIEYLKSEFSEAATLDDHVGEVPGGRSAAEDEPLLDYSGDFDLKRFSRFWRQAESYAYGAKEQLDLWK